MPEKIDIVNVFRRSEFVPEVVEEAIRLRLPAIWMQEGVVHEAAAEKARQAGIFVVMDRCILKEHRRVVAVRFIFTTEITEAQRNSIASAPVSSVTRLPVSAVAFSFSDFYFLCALCASVVNSFLSFLISSSRALMRFSMPSSVGW